MYLENYLYNPISSSIQPFMLINFNGTNFLVPNSNHMHGGIKLSDNLHKLINKNSYIMFAISDYLIEHQEEIRKSFKTNKDKRTTWNEFTPSVLASFSINEDDPNSINLAKEISRFPLTNENQASKILHNLTLIQTGFSIDISDPTKYANIFYATDISQPYLILKALVAHGYLEPITDNNQYIITHIGKAISQKAHESQLLKTAFIAMSFSDSPHEGMPSDDLDQIKAAFKTGIKNAGYEPIVINEVKHNNYITVEIENQIEKCAFLVEDLTYKNEGAIHEAALAEGKGKPAIRCIRKAEFEDPHTRPHFDYIQKNMIIWSTYEELSQRLEEHIKGSIGNQ